MNAHHLLEQYLQLQSRTAALAGVSEPGWGQRSTVPLSVPANLTGNVGSIPPFQPTSSLVSLQNLLQGRQMPFGLPLGPRQASNVFPGDLQHSWQQDSNLNSVVDTLRKQILASVGVAAANNAALSQQQHNNSLIASLRGGSGNVAGNPGIQAIFSGTLAMLPASAVSGTAHLEQLRRTSAGPEVDNLLLHRLLGELQARERAKMQQPPSSDTTLEPPTKKPRKAYTFKHVKESFPEKIYRMLEYVESKGLTDIISWYNDGTAFRVHQPEKFLHEIVPLFFAQRQFDSFRRQLGNYGFERADNGRGEYVYANPNFVMGRRELLTKIERTNGNPSS